MDVVELDCPSCGTLLEVDRGFAGGVCRCFHCGALLTVPTRASVRPERLSRPERPGRPETPGQVDRPESPHEVEADAVENAGAADDLFDDEGPATYTTASGRTFQFDDEEVPTARQRRKVVRATTYGVVIGLTLLIVAGAALGILLLLSTIDGTTRSDASDSVDAVEVATTFTYDPLANPLRINQPNALGLPLEASNAVVLDLAAESEPWAASVAEMLAAGAARVRSGQTLQVVIAHAGGTEVIAAIGGDESAVSRMRIVADRFSPAGAPDFSAAVKQALESAPDQLVLITGRDLPRETIAAVIEACAAQEDLRLSIFTIDVEMLDLSDAARRSGGEAQLIPRNRINTWREDAALAAPGR